MEQKNKNYMKKKIVSILIFLCALNLCAQNNVVVTVSQSWIKHTEYITTTITNKNAEIIIIPVMGFSDNYGNVTGGGSSYITLNTYNSDSKLYKSSNEMIICRDPSYTAPLYIKILPNQSYKKTELLYSTYYRGGYFDYCNQYQLQSAFMDTVKYFEAKVHLTYMYSCDSNPTIYVVDLVSTKKAYKREWD